MAIGDSFSDPALSYECDLTAERDRLRAVLTALDNKIGHFADAPASPDMPMLSIIGDVARIVRAALAPVGNGLERLT